VPDLDRKPHVRATDQRRRPAHKTRLVRIAHIARMEEMIGGYFRQDRHYLPKLPAPLPFVKNSPNQLRFPVNNFPLITTV
jgi:hypothetical protein